MKSMKQLRQEYPDTKVLYHLNYWDGAISGVCIYKGQRQYFEMWRESESKYSWNDDWSEWEKYCKENDIEILQDYWEDDEVGM